MKPNHEMPPVVLQWIEDMRAEAYQKGWDEATAALLAAAEAKRPAPSGPPSRGARIERLILKHRSIGAGESNREKVIRALKAQPGMRPAEITRWVQNADPTSNRLSILTMVKRMQKDRTIRKRGKGLHLADASDQEVA